MTKLKITAFATTSAAVLTLYALRLYAQPAGHQEENPKEKSPIHGLVTMGGLGPLLAKGGHADNTLKEANVHPGVYSAVVILATWDELEHIEGGLDSSSIDTGLESVRAYNQRYPNTPVTAKLRVFWALQCK